MVLTVTCSYSIATVNRGDVQEMIVAAIGCNLAWGLIDAVFYLMARYGEKGRGILALEALRKTDIPDEAKRIIADTLHPLLASVLTLAEFEQIHQRLNNIPEPPKRPHLSKEDLLGAVSVFLLVFLSTFPVLVPLLLVGRAGLALRISNGVAILMLFLTGYALGRYSGRSQWLTGLVMVLVGCVLVGACIALGG